MKTSSVDTAVLDGVTIEHGLANGIMAFDQYGAGVLNLGKLELRNATIRHCTSTEPGSALINSGIQAVVILDLMTFYGNSDPHLVNSNGGTVIWKNQANLIPD
jgi:hypothetical protein